MKSIEAVLCDLEDHKQIEVAFFLVVQSIDRSTGKIILTQDKDLLLHTLKRHGFMMEHQLNKNSEGNSGPKN